MSKSQAIKDPLASLTQKDDSSMQYLTFSLANEYYGVEILRVQEIKAWQEVTHIPNAADYLCGVFNLRGQIVPLVDLRLLFAMPRRVYTPRTVIVVLQVMGETDRTVAIIVDEVSSAHDVMPEDIKPSPDFGWCIDTRFISGLVSIDNVMLILLDIDMLLSVEALG